MKRASIAMATVHVPHQLFVSARCSTNIFMRVGARIRRQGTNRMCISAAYSGWAVSIGDGRRWQGTRNFFRHGRGVQVGWKALQLARFFQGVS